MAVATNHQWKQFMEGLRRGDVGPYTQTQRTSGTDRYREYRDGSALKAWLCVEGGSTGNDAGALPYVFDINLSDLSTTSYIYVPSNQDLDDWEEAGLDIEAEITARE